MPELQQDTKVSHFTSHWRRHESADRRSADLIWKKSTARIISLGVVHLCEVCTHPKLPKDSLCISDYKCKLSGLMFSCIDIKHCFRDTKLHFTLMGQDQCSCMPTGWIQPQKNFKLYDGDASREKSYLCWRSVRSAMESWMQTGWGPQIFQDKKDHLTAKGFQLGLIIL